ncbi:hypothetical protein E5F05_00635 (plasmid) [Deinococcus metallilatus]|uniref:SH3b domain-containing protein n=1 Tax=Deinococcus metallilatus TaxID=1211322 RepID=A0AAJ5FC52_9DEIO|nr:hypothetical protein E5F05_00635 [Deinococcus metallilatus]RXJ17846.1 hypothetical protein ERJ73_00245 [Deinococcus metallilatus]TLK32118.1 hypothetical protein FCS05_01265 [Deinococcus metallilatus]
MRFPRPTRRGHPQRTTTNLNLRSGSSAQTAKVATPPAGTAVQLVSCSSGWCKVSVPGADVQEMVEALVWEPDVLCDRLGALPFQRGAETTNVSGEAGTLPRVVEGFQTGRQEVGTGPLPVVGDGHVRQDRSSRRGAAESRPGVTKSC